VVIATVSGGLIDAFGSGGRRMVPPRIKGTTVAAVALVVSVVYGGWRLSQADHLSPGPTVLLVQTNVPQDNKIGWTSQAQAEMVPMFLRETVDGLTLHGGEIDLVIWPETMVPGVGFDGETAEIIAAHPGFSHARQWAAAVESLAKAVGTPMLVGTETWTGITIEDRDGSQWLRRGEIFNSAVLVEPDGKASRADKVFLQPFGERLPWVDAWPWLADQVLGLAPGGMAFALTAAPSSTVLHLPWNDSFLPFGAPICIEDAAPWVCREMAYDNGVKRVSFLANLSNDGWFGGSLSGRQRHVQAAQLRAVENRVPLVRASNTGQSVSIDSMGRVAAVVGDGGAFNIAGHLATKMTLDDRETIAGRFVGGGVGWVCLAGMIGGVILGRCVRRPSQ
jgi:apolipoprotein N-acyltransferase